VNGVAVRVADFAYGQLVKGFEDLGDVGLPVAESQGAVAAVLADMPHNAIDAISNYSPGADSGADHGKGEPAYESVAVGAVESADEIDDVPTVQSVVDWARENAAAARDAMNGTPSTNGVAKGPGADGVDSIPRSGGVCPYPLNIVDGLNDPSVPGYGVDPLHDVLAFLNAGGIVTSINAYPNLGGGSGSWTVNIVITFPDGSSGNFDILSQPIASAGNHDFGQSHVPGWPSDLVPLQMAKGQTTGCGNPVDPPFPVTTLPPPPPPPEVSPVPLPDMTCCPAPEPVVVTYDPSQAAKLKPSNDPEATGSWCTYINGVITDFGLDIPQEGPELPPPIPGVPPSPLPPPPPKPTGMVSGTKKIPDWMKWNTAPEIGSESQANIDQFAWGQQGTNYLASTLTPSDADRRAVTTLCAGVLAGAGWIGRITGGPAEYLVTEYDQALKYLNPKFLPGQSGIDLGWLSGQVSESDWECMTRSNGNLPGIHRKLRDTQVAKPAISNVIDLYMREQIDYAEMKKRLEFQGVKDETDIELWLALRDAFPPLGDIIRFMVRDTQNEQVVKDGKLEEGFNDNWSGLLQFWARAQGFTKDIAMEYWKAHWEMPSPTQAFTMQQRLRPGRVADDLVTTPEQIYTLLGTADYAPGWRAKLQAVSYNVPTRTDIKQGYALGIYKRPETIEALQDTGLDKNGAEFVTRLYDVEKERRQRTIAERNSAWTVKVALSQFVEGLLTREETKTVLKTLGVDEKQLDTILDSAELKRVTRERAACSKAVRRRYWVGANTETVARSSLVRQGWDKEAADAIVNTWSCERAAGLQEVPARKNVEWAVSGVITLQELAVRLGNLRYSQTDIDRFIAEAINRISKAAAAAAEKAYKERLANYEKLIKEQEKRLKELQKLNKDCEGKPKKKTGG
jgi:hypothetical protein